MCDTMHGKCVLIPRSVVQIVGNLDPAFVHYIGDWDYGLRTRQEGCTVWIAPGYLGTCSLNP
jgi:GT2 family glycosyltransferase